MVPETIVKALAAAERILCVSHIEPDGDAYGSALGLKWILEAMGKRVVVGIDSPKDDAYAFLPGYAEIRRAAEVQGPFDLVVITDSSSPDRMGNFRDLPAVQQAPWSVIDHHPTNMKYGTEGLNWVAADALSACNLIVRLSAALGVACNAEAKKCLMTGMITDSQCFRVFGTDRAFMQDVLQVMGPDSFSPYDIVSRTLGAMALFEMQIWAQVLPTLQFDGGIVWLTMEEEALVEPGERIKTGGLIQLLMRVREAEVAVIFTERLQNDGRRGVTCSFRCRPHLDVSNLALAYGGGGHKMASGCFIEAPLQQTVHEIVGKLKFMVAHNPVPSLS